MAKRLRPSKNLAIVGSQQAYERLHKHRLSRTALAYNQIGLAGVESGVDIVEYRASVERLGHIFDFDHCRRSFVSITSNKRIKILLLTTPSVLALPTCNAPPLT